MPTTINKYEVVFINFSQGIIDTLSFEFTNSGDINYSLVCKSLTTGAIIPSTNSFSLSSVGSIQTIMNLINSGNYTTLITPLVACLIVVVN
jgi:hypothetical protein